MGKNEIVRFASALAVLTALGISAGPVRALQIVPTFDGSYNASQQAVVNNALGQFGSLFSDPITIGIKFGSMNTGLGQSSTWIYSPSYGDYYNALNADKTTANDITALSHLTAGPNDPVKGNSGIYLSYANCLAVGLGCSATPDNFAGTVKLNLSLVDSNRSNGISSGSYDMMSVVMHEVDEVLGLGSAVGTSLAYVRPQDLFRFDLNGNRTFTTAGDNAYFSIDGGATTLARFNQNSGADYGDWWSTGSHTAHVQDAFGTPGVLVNYGAVEMTALDVIGYNLASPVPEPATYAMLLAGLGLLGFAALRRQQQRAA